MSIGEPNSFHRPAGSGVRNTQESIHLILNPRAGAGKAGTRLSALKRALDGAFAQWELHLTEAPGHAAHLAREAACAGADIVAAVGGDGTCHEVINGLIEDRAPVRRKTIFTVIPIGTGGDLARTLRMPARLEEALWLAGTGITLPSDVGLATTHTPDGDREEAFINVAGFGMNGAVVRHANASSKRLGGRATFLLSTLSTLRTYTPCEVTVKTTGPDGEHTWSGPLLSGFIANGGYCGGGMWVGRGGTMQDGVFDLTLLPPVPLSRQLRDARRLYDGTLERTSGAVRRKVHTVDVSAARPIPIDLDGESPGTAPARFELLPRAIQIRGGWLPDPSSNA